MKNSVTVSVPLLLILALLFSPAGARAADFETPPILEAKDLLPADLLKGRHHEVEPQVVNDGYMNHYTIRSDFGTFEARSTAMARIRIREVGGIAQLRELSETKAFADALAVDHLVWTEDIFGAAARMIGEMEGNASFERVELWALGSLSPRSRKDLESLGWAVHERAAGKMGIAP